MNQQGKLTFVFAVVSLIITSCSNHPTGNDKKASSADRGKQLGENFCQCMGDIESLSSRMALQSRLDSCDNIKESEWNLSENDYKADSAQWKQYQDAYAQATLSKMDAYREKMKGYAAELAREIQDGLQRGFWIKSDDDKAEHVCTFSDGQLKFINASGKTSYSLQADTLIFDDKIGTKATARFDRNGKLTLTSCQDGQEGSFNKASDKDKLVGQWSVKGGLSVIFYANGNCTVSQGYNTRTSSFTLKGDVLEIDGPPAYSISLSNPDRFAWGQASFSRVKGAYPKSLNILF